MKMHNCEQGTIEWMTIRAGRVTASELDNLVTPIFKARTGDMVASYLYKKVAEAYRGRPLEDEDFSNWHTERGQTLEEDARRYYCFNFDHARLTNVGFIEHDSGRFGCSPDALVGDDCGLEIKAPMSKTHVRYLLEGELPKEYAHQVHGSMYATGFPRWQFMSYARGFPAFLITVERDEEIQAKIQEALDAFFIRFDAALEKLRNA